MKENAREEEKEGFFSPLSGQGDMVHIFLGLKGM